MPLTGQLREYDAGPSSALSLQDAVRMLKSRNTDGTGDRNLWLGNPQAIHQTVNTS